LLRAGEVETGSAERSWGSCRILECACCSRLAWACHAGITHRLALGSLSSLSKLHDGRHKVWGRAWLRHDWKATMLSAASPGTSGIDRISWLFGVQSGTASHQLRKIARSGYETTRREINKVKTVYVLLSQYNLNAFETQRRILSSGHKSSLETFKRVEVTWYSFIAL